MGFFDLSTVSKRFRFVAVLEAVSWVFLIIGMVLKRIDDPILWPVKVFGMIHGIVFIAFLLAAVLAARELGWKWWVAVLALLSSIPPFFTVLFEMWAVRNGLLGELSKAPAGGAPAPVAARS
ncbi:DUF3817 domain-containing protein [Nocardia sp. 2]|uniref:DUF3817 domain-containing protein n=1 Tax=Nocardia acididurans TaxID=2802282 RepID=A0ABS1MCT5_9NOCA|nr:DUF3817 domain-containing protein [Nocardia acididurans]MBL1078096.1 DUF3817 domain-containing protein [Nocardia acididurans]